MSDALAKILLGSDVDDALKLRVGTVSGTAPVEVTLLGQSGLTASHLASYTPATSDLVAILQNNTDLLILGSIVSGG